MSSASSSPRSEFLFEVRVYYEDTDAGGVVYHANYLRFFERARTEWLRALGYDQYALAQREQRLFVVRSIDTRFHAPARLDDILQIRSVLTRLGRASLTFEQRCLRHDQCLASAEVQVGCLEASAFKPAALPVGLHQALAPLVHASPSTLFANSQPLKA